MKYGELNLGQVEAIINKLGGMEGVQRFLSGELVVKAVCLLARVASATVSGAKKFVAKDHLKSANVGWISGNFDKLFLNKVEESVGDANLAVSSLTKDSLDAPILAELGDRAETSLAYLFELISKQSKGEDGVLLTNGYANIAYVRGNDGNLWAVSAYWNSVDGYWSVGAYSVGYPYRWVAGRQFLSRDS